MTDNKYTITAINILLTMLIFYLFKELPYLRNSFQALVTIVVIPLLMGGFFYYLFRPLARFLENYVTYKPLAVSITLIIIVTLISFTFYFGGSIIRNQMNSLIAYFTNFYNALQQNDQDSQNNQNNMFNLNEKFISFLDKFEVRSKLVNIMQKIINGLRNNIGLLVSTITNISTAIVLIPFVVLYLLLDDEKISQNIINLIPPAHREEWSRTLHKIDNTLVTYLGGQLIIASILGVLTYIGYLIIDLPNALILAFIGMITSLVPLIGPVIGALPALLVALTTDWLLALKVIIVIVLVQQLEGNIVRPNVEGTRLNIHPLMVIFLVLSFIVLFGVLGALFAVPVYAVFRVVLNDRILNRDRLV